MVRIRPLPNAATASHKPGQMQSGESKKKGEHEMTEVGFIGITESGCCVYTSVSVPEDYTMTQLVRAIKNAGYVRFCTNTMKKFAEVI